MDTNVTPDLIAISILELGSVTGGNSPARKKAPAKHNQDQGSPTSHQLWPTQTTIDAKNALY